MIYWPDTAGAAITPRWCFLSLVVPLALYGLNPRLGWRGLIPALLLGWAGLSLVWTTSLPDGLFVFGELALLVGAGWIGAQLRTLRPVYFGAALGMGVSSVLIILEVFGIDVIKQLSQARPGLFFNPNTVTESAVLVFVACFASRLYWPSVLTLPALFLTHARGALAALVATTMVWTWRRTPYLALLVAVAVFALSLSLRTLNTGNPDDFRGGNVTNWGTVTDRVMMWKDAAYSLTWLGTGIGSFRPEFLKAQFRDGNALARGRTDHAHNDLLEMTLELGLPGLALCLMLLWGGWRGPYEPEQMVVLVFFFMGLVQFPLWMPLTGTLAAMAIGRQLSGQYS